MSLEERALLAVRLLLRVMLGLEMIFHEPQVDDVVAKAFPDLAPSSKDESMSVKINEEKRIF